MHISFKAVLNKQEAMRRSSEIARAHSTRGDLKGNKDRTITCAGKSMKMEEIGKPVS